MPPKPGKVKILYYSYGKGENERVIDPAEMFLFQDGWYCAAFCEKKQDIRHFELKRIITYELLEEKNGWGRITKGWISSQYYKKL